MHTRTHTRTVHPHTRRESLTMLELLLKVLEKFRFRLPLTQFSPSRRNICNLFFTHFSLAFLYSIFTCEFPQNFLFFCSFSLVFDFKLSFFLLSIVQHTENSSWRFSAVDFSLRIAWCMPWAHSSAAQRRQRQRQRGRARVPLMRRAQKTSVCSHKGVVFAHWRHLSSAYASVAQQVRVSIDKR